MHYVIMVVCLATFCSVGALVGPGETRTLAALGAGLSVGALLITAACDLYDWYRYR